jgi:hypothetical protein
VFLALTLPLNFACAPANDTPSEKDTWSLTPPTLETGSAQNGEKYVVKINLAAAQKFSSDFIGMSRPVLTPLAVLRFADQDRDLKLTFETSCQTATPDLSRTRERETNAPVVYSGETRTSDQVDLLTFLPPQVLNPQSLKTTHACDLKMTVINPHGSRHSFQVDALEFDLRSLLDPTNDFYKLQEDRPLAADETWRLICPDWWVTSSPSIRSLKELSKAFRLDGGNDTRHLNRAPLCTVMKQESLRWLYVGTYRPHFESTLEIPFQSTILFPKSANHDLFNQPVSQWEFHNPTSLPLGIYIPSADFALKLSARNVTPGYTSATGWSEFLEAPFVIASLSNLPVRRTSQGTYLLLPPGKAAPVILRLQRPGILCRTATSTSVTIAHFPLSYVFSALTWVQYFSATTTPQIAFKASRTLSFQTLANALTPEQFDSYSNDELDGLTKDAYTSGETSRLLIPEKMILNFQSDSATAQLSNRDFDREFEEHRRTQRSACIKGQHLDKNIPQEHWKY